MMCVQWAFLVLIRWVLAFLPCQGLASWTPRCGGATEPLQILVGREDAEGIFRTVVRLHAWQRTFTPFAADHLVCDIVQKGLLTIGAFVDCNESHGN